MTLRPLFALGTCLTGLLFACQAGPTPVAARSVPSGASPPNAAADPTPPSSLEFELVLDEPRSVELAGQPLRLVWTELSDSRCPRGAQCAWAGEARIGVTVEAASAEPARIELSLRPGNDDAARATTLGHSFTLLSVEPYPDQSAKPARGDHRARLSVESRAP